jgi:hypothetical protein
MRKFTSLFLVFSILLLSGNTFANERKGAELIIQKTDRTQVRGELIAIKENALLLLDRESGSDVTINIVDTKVITIEKRQVLEWCVPGLLVGTFVGFFIGSSLEEENSQFNLFKGLPTLVGTITGVVIGLGTGLIIGLSTKGAKKIRIEGRSDSEIQEILEKLRKKARIKNLR